MPGSTLGAPLSGDVVNLRMAPLAAHVRTARLVTGATARRAGLPPEIVDEVKLAVGEASTRAVELHAHTASDELVDISLSWNATALSVVVSDRGPAGSQLPTSDTLSDLADVDGDAPDGGPSRGEIALAVVQGLVDDVEISPRPGGGTTITMRWPIEASPLS